jgi:hypothetical protein
MRRHQKKRVQWWVRVRCGDFRSDPELVTLDVAPIHVGALDPPLYEPTKGQIQRVIQSRRKIMTDGDETGFTVFDSKGTEIAISRRKKESDAT